MLDDFERIADNQFKSGRAFDIWQGIGLMFGLDSYDLIEHLEHDVEQVDAEQHTCHLCGRSDRFVPEGDNLLVCDHSHDYELDDYIEYVPIRVVSHYIKEQDQWTTYKF